MATFEEVSEAGPLDFLRLCLPGHLSSQRSLERTKQVSDPYSDWLVPTNVFKDAARGSCMQSYQIVIDSRKPDDHP